MIMKSANDKSMDVEEEREIKRKREFKLMANDFYRIRIGQEI
jgi:hypothetical protein